MKKIVTACVIIFAILAVLALIIIAPEILIFAPFLMIALGLCAIVKALSE